ncbi:TPA: hypothetical protein ACPHTX_001311 [Vibrio antiquarius]
MTKLNQKGIGIIELESGREAMFILCSKYFKIICGAIFAIVLAKPELASSIQFIVFDIPLSMANVISFYMISVFPGAFFYEKVREMKRRMQDETELPAIFKFIFVLYTTIGYAIFVLMVLKLVGAQT